MDNHEKENALNIVAQDRTYQIYAESPEDARYITSTYSMGKTNSYCLFALSAPLYIKVMCGDKVPPCGCLWKFICGVIFNDMFADWRFLNSL